MIICYKQMKAAIELVAISPGLSQFEASYGVVNEDGRITTKKAITTTTADDVQ